MRFRRPFDFDRRQMQVLEGLVSKYYDATEDKVPAYGAWRSMDGETLWKHLVRIIVAMGRSAPSYRLVESSDFDGLTIGSMKAFQASDGLGALIKRTHGILSKYNVRYCSPKKDSSLKAQAIVNNLNEPAIVKSTDLILLKNMAKARDPRSFLMETVHGYGMKSASEFLIEIGYSQDYLAFDARLKRAFSLLFNRDFNRIRTPWDYLDFEEVFREEICPELGIKPSRLDAIIFWNYGDVLKTLKRLAK